MDDCSQREQSFGFAPLVSEAISQSDPVRRQIRANQCFEICTDSLTEVVSHGSREGCPKLRDIPITDETLQAQTWYNFATYADLQVHAIFPIGSGSFKFGGKKSNRRNEMNHLRTGRVKTNTDFQRSRSEPASTL